MASFMHVLHSFQGSSTLLARQLLPNRCVMRRSVELGSRIKLTDLLPATLHL